MRTKKPEIINEIISIKKKYSDKKDYYGYINTLPDNDKRVLEYDKQYEKLGFDNSVTWALYYQISMFILPRLIEFRDTAMSFPMGMESEEWDSILTEMIDAFQLIISDDCDYRLNSKLSKRVKKGMKLFNKYFLSLWS